MAAPKSTKRLKPETIQIRTTSEIKLQLETAAALAELALQAMSPGAKLGLGPWLVGLGLREAERVKKKPEK